jgi:cytochrome P450
MMAFETRGISVEAQPWPPGPQASADEQVRRWIETPVEFWEECARLYGSTVRLELGSLGTVVMFSDPAAVKEIFQLSPDCFECRHYNEHYRYVMGDHSLLLQDGDEHRRQRRLLSPIFRPDQLQQRAGSIRQIVLRAAQAWPQGEPFNLRPSLHEIAFQAILQLLFGEQESEVSRSLLTIYRECVLRQVGSWGPWRNFSRLQPRIRELLSAEIETRRAEPDRTGAMTRLSCAQDSGGRPVANAECEDHVFTLMIAGVDTTAVSLTWALYWLCREAGVRQRLRDELKSIGNAEPGPQLFSLPYLDAVFCETLRKYPIVPTPSGRKLTREVRIAGFPYAPGTTLVPCTYLVHRCEDLYPDSGRFLPERFLGRSFANHEYFPFGGGVRSCVGEMLAQYEFKIAIATILANYELRAEDDNPLKPVRHGTLLAPSEGFRVIVRPVRSKAADSPKGQATGVVDSK